MSSRTMSMRGRIAGASIVVAGLGLGLAPLASASSATNATSVPVIKVASSFKGVPYRWGGTTTHGFDCSGYVQFVFKKLGVALPRTAEEQYETVKHLTRSQLQVGDLVFFGGPGWVYHVGIYAGQNMFWDAPHSGSSVRLQKIWAGSKVYGRVRGLKLPAVTPSTAPMPASVPASAPGPVFTLPTYPPAPIDGTPSPTDAPVTATPAASPSEAPSTPSPSDPPSSSPTDSPTTTASAAPSASATPVS